MALKASESFALQLLARPVPSHLTSKRMPRVMVKILVSNNLETLQVLGE